MQASHAIGAANGRPAGDGPWSAPPRRASKGIKTLGLLRRIREAGDALAPRERWVLTTIAQRVRWRATPATEKWPARPKGTAWPEIPTIAHDTGYCIHTVEAALHRLRRSGWLQIEAAYTPGGHRTSSTYRITPPEGSR